MTAFQSIIPLLIFFFQFLNCARYVLARLYISHAAASMFNVSLVAHLPSYHNKAIKAQYRARLGFADHQSTTPTWGNPVKCFSQRHNK